jgi:hypothetical protein
MVYEKNKKKKRKKSDWGSYQWERKYYQNVKLYQRNSSL